MSNIRDIARISNTSLGTVSRVINKSGYVKDSTRERVEKAIQELGYEPNAGARQMRSGKTKLIGILLPALDVSFFGILAHTLEQRLFEKGYHSLICNTSENEEHEAKYISTLIAQNVEGIIAASVFDQTSNYSRIIQRNIPIIAIDRALPELPNNAVTVDHREGGRIMAKHLMDLGHTRIAVVGAPKHSTPIGLRVLGVNEIMAENGLVPTVIKLGDTHSFEACYDLAFDVLSAPNPPSAIIGTTDTAAIACIHAAFKLKFAVPQKLSVIGFDDLPETAFVIPQLTTVAQPIRELGRTAISQLLSLIEPKKPVSLKTYNLELKLIERDSTAPPFYSGSTSIE